MMFETISGLYMLAIFSIFTAVACGIRQEELEHGHPIDLRFDCAVHLPLLIALPCPGMQNGDANREPEPGSRYKLEDHLGSLKNP